MHDLKPIDMVGVILIASSILIGCSSTGSERKGNQQAIALHNSMVKKAKAIEDRLNQLRSDSTTNRDSVGALTEALIQWKADLIEVPGNEEHDHHAHGHGSNQNMPQITDEQMLEVQQELDRRLSLIEKRITNLKN